MGYFTSSLAKVLSNFVHRKNVNASFVIVKAQKSNETSGEITRTTGGNFRYMVAKLGSLGLVAFLLSKLN